MTPSDHRVSGGGSQLSKVIRKQGEPCPLVTIFLIEDRQLRAETWREAPCCYRGRDPRPAAEAKARPKLLGRFQKLERGEEGFPLHVRGSVALPTPGIEDFRPPERWSSTVARGWGGTNTIVGRRCPRTSEGRRTISPVYPLDPVGDGGSLRRAIS